MFFFIFFARAKRQNNSTASVRNKTHLSPTHFSPEHVMRSP